EKLVAIARDVVRMIGYEQAGFHWQHMHVECLVHEQSVDIAQGVDSDDSLGGEGAGDQGLMFGYACTETETLMPAPIHYAHRVLERLTHAWQNNVDVPLGPDAKSQVTLKYENGKPVGIDTIVVSVQHREGVSQRFVHDTVRAIVSDGIFPEQWALPSPDSFHINPTGIFEIGGPDGDAGLTGRKIIVDTYGGAAPHGGGAFSGKDPTKVDRSAAYAARHAAKNVVAAGLASKCLIQLSYAIGVADPTSIFVDCYNTETVAKAKIMDALMALDFRPRAIRERLALNKPIYLPTSSFGHFGRTPTDEGHFSWERTDLGAYFH
ncbi:MAG: methionine adenosyltransferase, partial [Alphaproteobacteria bacterium]|nr:methionine adenosyltransferase [Alphaproteobacteria bacterium]